MTIGITGRTTSPIPLKTSQKSEVEGEKKAAITTPENNDSIALTTATQEMKKTVGPSSAAPIDISRINSIKTALADGTYSINAEKTASKLIQFEKLMSPENST